MKCQCNKSNIMISAEQRRLELYAVTVLLYLIPITSTRIVMLLTNILMTASYGNLLIIIGGDFNCTFLLICQMNLSNKECIKQQQNSLTNI